MSMGEISDLKAQMLWNALTDEVHSMLLHNVYCPRCIFANLDSDATLNMVRDGRNLNELLRISGYCRSCGTPVSRIINHRSYPTRDKAITFDGIIRSLRDAEIAKLRRVADN